MVGNGKLGRVDAVFVVGLLLFGLLGFGSGYVVRSVQVQAVKAVKPDYSKPWWSGSRLMAMCSRTLGDPCVAADVESNGNEVYGFKLMPRYGVPGDEQIASPSQ